MKDVCRKRTEALASHNGRQMFSWSGFNKRFHRAIVDAAAHRKPRFGSTYECR